MNVLLVYPEFPVSFWSFKYALKIAGCKAALPPLGLLTVAAMLPPEWNLRLVDLNTSKLTKKDLAWANAVLISAMIIQRESAKEVIARCHATDLPIIAGGPLFTEESENFSDVDYLVLGEAEEILPEFLKDFESGTAKHLYQAPGFADIKTTPVPRFGLLNMGKYASMAIQFSRGCPFNCEFCDVVRLFGHRPRTKTANQIIQELDTLWNAGWRGSIFFVDDNFIGNKKYLKETLLPALIIWQNSHRESIQLYTEASINLADDPELMRLMVEAGFNQVFIGIETPDALGLAECNKTQNKNRDLQKCIDRILAAGMQVQAGFIIGFDSDGPGIFERQIKFIGQSGIVTAMVGVLQAIRGTKLYERLEKEGRILEEEVSGNNVGTGTNIKTRMDPEVLTTGYRELMQHLYAPKQYYERIRTFLKKYHPAQNRGGLHIMRSIMPFTRSVLYLGILGKERWRFWGLMLWILFHNPRFFRIGITHAAYGRHFRIVANQEAQVQIV